MPLLIYRYILADLLKVFAITTLVLVSIIAFGATIDPLTDGGLLSTTEAARYMVLAMVPMLQFALPFAAGFASTIVLHRMTGDNEILAAAASGISYRRILGPIFALGVVLTMVMVVLTQSVIPRLVVTMERMAAEDVARLLQHAIESGQTARLGNVQVYADDLRIITNPSDTDADMRFALFRVAVAELDSENRIIKDGTAAQAIVDLHRRFGETYLKIAMSDTVAFEAHTGQRGGWGEGEGPGAIVIQSRLRDSLRARTRSELLALRDEPERYIKVREDREAIERALLDHDIDSAIVRSLQERGEMEFIQRGPSRRRLVVRADAFQDSRFMMNQSDLVPVRQYEGATLSRRMDAEQVIVSRTGYDDAGNPLFHLELLNVQVHDLGAGGLRNNRARLGYDSLQMSGLAVSVAANESLQELMTRAAESAHAATEVARLARRLDALDREITSRILARYAQSVTAMLLLIFGAALAMLLRGTLPLIIYIWAFLPSVLNLIMISGGDKVVRDGDIAVGLSVMWGGNAVLAILFLVVYWRLSRN